MTGASTSRESPSQPTRAARTLEHEEWLKQRFVEVGGNVRVLQRELAEKGVDAGYSTLIQCDGIEIAGHLECRGRYQKSLVPAHAQGLNPRIVREIPPDLGRYELAVGGTA